MEQLSGPTKDYGSDARSNTTDYSLELILHQNSYSTAAAKILSVSPSSASIAAQLSIPGKSIIFRAK
jgi:hypothetical protein